MPELIHLHKNPLNHSHHLFLLFIPAVIFIFLVVILFARLEKNPNQTLGVSTEQIP